MKNKDDLLCNPPWFSLVGRRVVKPVILSRKTGAEGRVQDQTIIIMQEIV